MARNHASYFSYNLSRPYPFRWFTPVAILGATVLTALFSVLNFAANGYVLGSKFVADPNTTLAEKAWFEKPPFSYQSRLSTSCQAANIAPGTQLAAKSGFQYELGSVWTEDATGNSVALPSLTYLNNSFANCDFQGVQIFLLNYDPVNNGPFWNWNRDSSATVSRRIRIYQSSANKQAYMTCTIDNSQLPTYLNLSITVKSNLQGSPANDGFGFLKAKKETHASLWFGQFLMYEFQTVAWPEVLADWTRWLNFNQMLYQMAKVDIALVTNSGICKYDITNLLAF